MRRICFDTESNYYWNGEEGYLGDPTAARNEFRKKLFRFDAATAFVYETGEHKDFTRYEELFEFLLQADELISFNGRTCDLIVLESLVGENAVKQLWQKPHHDLKGWQGQSLEDAIRRALPEKIQEFKSLIDSRKAELAIADEFIRDKLARSFRDAKFTMMLFDKYRVSGEQAFTFC